MERPSGEFCEVAGKEGEGNGVVVFPTPSMPCLESFLMLLKLKLWYLGIIFFITHPVASLDDGSYYSTSSSFCPCPFPVQSETLNPSCNIKKVQPLLPLC